MKKIFQVHIYHNDQNVDESKLYHYQLHPKIIVYHWERPTLKQFLLQRFNSGSEVMKAKKNWPKKFFPEKKTLWWFGRCINFIVYIVKKKHIYKIPVLIPLFLIERNTTIIGRLKENLELNIKIKS